MDEIFEEAGKLKKWTENDALNMQYKVPREEEYDTLSNKIEQNVGSYGLPTPKDRDAHRNRCHSSDDIDDDVDYRGGDIPQSFSMFFSDSNNELEGQMHRFSMVFEDEDDDEPSIRKGRA
ncbi:hypothetical protein QJS10_CPB04g01511 [Acorus calamus]|uniref:Uncharacterized protein n=1 Tax=Acorus calamus TaxID=4465 RepID=A0AAV9F1M3_ACOCL|nr:hypothetical protein QJS10_CPB04g01511 [Acorus calamus]